MIRWRISNQPRKNSWDWKKGFKRYHVSEISNLTNLNFYFFYLLYLFVKCGCMNTIWGMWGSYRIPTVKLKISGKSRIQRFCYIQVIVFDLSYLPVVAIRTWQVRYHEENVKNIKRAKVKNYNLNVKEVRYPAFLILFHGIFNFTVGILMPISSWNFFAVEENHI